MKKRPGRPTRPTIEGARAVHIRRRLIALLLHSSLSFEDLAELLAPLEQVADLVAPPNRSLGLSLASIVTDIQLRKVLDPKTRRKAATAPIDAERGILYDLICDKLAMGADNPLHVAIGLALKDVDDDEPANRKSALKFIDHYSRAARTAASTDGDNPFPTTNTQKKQLEKWGGISEVMLFVLAPGYLRRSLEVYARRLRHHALRGFEKELRTSKRDIVLSLSEAMPRAQTGRTQKVHLEQDLSRLDRIADRFEKTSGTLAKLRRKGDPNTSRPTSEAELEIKRFIFGRDADGHPHPDLLTLKRETS